MSIKFPNTSYPAIVNMEGRASVVVALDSGRHRIINNVTVAWFRNDGTATVQYVVSEDKGRRSWNTMRVQSIVGVETRKNTFATVSKSRSRNKRVVEIRKAITVQSNRSK